VADASGGAAVDRLLLEARARIAPRVAASELDAAVAGGALVVDTRPAALRLRDGALPGAVVVERNVLEWRLDPTSPHRLKGMDALDRRVVVVCDEGYASSLSAASLKDLGLTNVTDLEGGFQAWRRSTATPCRSSSRREVD
jgi:rhodanese-related sulfurtransferase